MPLGAAAATAEDDESLAHLRNSHQSTRGRQVMTGDNIIQSSRPHDALARHNEQLVDISDDTEGDEDEDSSTMSSLVTSTELDPRPFVRHIGDAIRLRPRINSCKDLRPLTRPRIPSTGSRILIKEHARPAPSSSHTLRQERGDEKQCGIRTSSSSWSLRLPAPSSGGEPSPTSSSLPIDHSQTGDEDPFGTRRRRRQMFCSLRSSSHYGQQQRRRLLMLLPASRSSSYSVRPSSISLTNLASSSTTDLYLEAARQKKQMIVMEQMTSIVSSSNWQEQQEVLGAGKFVSSMLETTSVVPPLSYDQQLEGIRQALGFVPPYVELSRGRLHLKLIQGRYRT